ncbi:MAG TPA: hypothetical protein VKU86_03185, partial [Acidimicrobiales bacterium]|nr:hypothetical protein [Acidimicrobiales bacterium]
MTDTPHHTGEIRSARRATRTRRPASRTLARASLMVSLPGASLLLATGGHVANLAERGHKGHPDHHDPHVESPLQAMRRLLQEPRYSNPAPPTPTTTAPPSLDPPPSPAVAA